MRSVLHAAPSVPHRTSEFKHSFLRLPVTSLNLLLVGRGNDILARDWMIHLTRCVWEPAHESPVENAGGDKGVDVPNSETVHV